MPHDRVCRALLRDPPRPTYTVGVLFSKKTPELTQESLATSAAQAEAGGGKGRPTPKRREAEAANRRPLVAGDAGRSPEAKAKVRAERARVREAMLSGEEKYLPPRDRGPERRFLRDAVDTRRNIGEIILPAMIAVLAVSFLPWDWARVWTFVIAYSLMILGILDVVFLWRRTKAQFTEVFGHPPTKGSASYVVLRSFQMRSSRVPRPAVKRGDPLVRRGH